VKLGLSLLAIVGLGLALGLEARATDGGAPDDELERELERISAAGKARDLDELERAGERIERRWTGEPYVALMARLCDEVRSWDHDDASRQLALEQRFAKAALAIPGEIRIEHEVALLLHLQEELDQVPEVPEDPWARQRLAGARRWLQAWSRLQREIDEGFDFEDMPALSVEPPAGSGVEAGTSPEAVEDPELRKRYEEAIEDNQRKAAEYSRQMELRRLDRKFSPVAERYLIRAYSRDPAGVEELETLLEQYVADDAVRRRILSSVKERG
jgi:hypothetical protein